MTAGGGAARAATLSPLLFTGFALASIGGPLALAAIFVPQAAGDASGLATLLGVAVFLAPLAIWLRYSERIASAGGLAAFVEAAAGRRAALVQGWIWAFAYFLYLPYTITFVVYDVLTPVFPGIVPARSALELLLPLGIVAVVLLPLRALLAGVLALAAVQLALVLVLGGLELARAPRPRGTFSVAHLDPTARGGAAVGLLFVCASLPLFLGGEARGGARTVRRGLVAAFALAAAYVLFAAIPLAGVPESLRDAAVPGVSIAQAYSGRALAVAIGAGTAVSIGLLIVAEYVALTRLLHWLHGVRIRTATLWIAVPFVALDAVSLADPNRFYDDALKPSLGALFVAELVAVAAYPLFRARAGRRVGAASLAVAAIASGLMAWGFYTLVSGSSAT